MQNTQEKRKCQECGCNIYGRSDKKFCSEQCRNNHYNKLNRDVNVSMRNINNILRKNRRILQQHNPNGNCRIHRDTLLLQGFNFEYFTNTFTTKTGLTYKFCYDQGYLSLNEGHLVVVESFEGMNGQTLYR